MILFSLIIILSSMNLKSIIFIFIFSIAPVSMTVSKLGEVSDLPNIRIEQITKNNVDEDKEITPMSLVKDNLVLTLFGVLLVTIVVLNYFISVEKQISTELNFELDKKNQYHSELLNDKRKKTMMSVSDEKEGFVFVSNPCYQKASDLKPKSKSEELTQELERLERENHLLNEEIKREIDKEKILLDELDFLTKKFKESMRHLESFKDSDDYDIHKKREFGI